MIQCTKGLESIGNRNIIQLSGDEKALHFLTGGFALEMRDYQVLRALKVQGDYKESSL